MRKKISGVEIKDDVNFIGVERCKCKYRDTLREEIMKDL